jgi:cob(I)alamin adenosyltransferase
LASIKVYTKTGDAGTTGLVGGSRISKSETRLDAYGTVDELNAVVGLIQCSLESYAFQGAERFLKKIQNQLFNVGSQLACIDEKLSASLPLITEENILAIEKEIDEMTTSLPELKTFILPGGNVLAAQSHLARTVCRRAERECCRLQESQNLPPTLIPYLNRLSDYFFVLARFFNHSLGVQDIPWEK